MKIRYILWSIRLFMIFCFVVFSLIPLLLAISLLFFSYLSSYFARYLGIYMFSVILIILLGLIAVYGIVKFKIELRLLITALFSCGLLFYLQNPYLLALGVILTWSFYEIWYIAYKYNQLDQEYSTYLSNSIEIQKLMKTFQIQFNSFILLVWIVLSISWGILLLANYFYIELGTGEFGTLGISISIAIILLIRLVRDHFGSQPTHPME
ncbi:MAG: hypothetical protein JSW11_03765 [Candidatus Heimdallarchaeota archaeon]|nr:MAG: hypothetical protein JSW11_03765 [Candidatus Heimdallarchaeota archaeon]